MERKTNGSDERMSTKCSTNMSFSQRNKAVQPPDGGWGWMVVFSAFLINIITDGCSYSFGVLFVFLLEYFKETRSSTAWIGSAFCAVPLLCGPIASVVTNRLGIRKATIIGGLITAFGFVSSAFVSSVSALAITYGVIAGIGISMPYLNSIVIVAVYFKKKRTLATGLAESGAGIGTLIFAPLYEILIESYGWRGAVMIIGAISLNIVVCGAVFVPLKIEQENEPSDDVEQTDIETEIQDVDLDDDTNVDVRDTSLVPLNKQEAPPSKLCTKEGSIATLENYESEKSKQNKSVCSRVTKHLTFLSNKSFLTFTASSVILYFWYDVPYVFSVDRAKEFGISEKMASYMVAVIGVTHTFGNVLYGFIGDREQINRRFLYGCSLILTGAVLNIIPSFTHFLPCTILVGLFGIFSASAEALTSVIIVDILGIEKLNDAYGVVMFLQGVVNLIGPPFAGWLYDVSSSYDNTFYSAGSCICIAGLLVISTRACSQRNDKE